MRPLRGYGQSQATGVRCGSVNAPLKLRGCEGQRLPSKKEHRPRGNRHRVTTECRVAWAGIRPERGCR